MISIEKRPTHCSTTFFKVEVHARNCAEPAAGADFLCSNLVIFRKAATTHRHFLN